MTYWIYFSRAIQSCYNAERERIIPSRDFDLCLLFYISCVNCASQRISQRLQLHRKVVNCVWSRWFAFLSFFSVFACAPGHTRTTTFKAKLHAWIRQTIRNSRWWRIPRRDNVMQISYRSWGSCFGIILGCAFATRINTNWRHSQSECVCARARACDLRIHKTKTKKLLIHWMHCARHRRAENYYHLLLYFLCNNKR